MKRSTENKRLCADSTAQRVAKLVPRRYSLWHNCTFSLKKSLDGIQKKANLLSLRT